MPLQCAQFREDSLTFGIKLLGLAGGDQLAANSIEQLEAQLVFRMKQDLAESGLRYVEHGGGAGHSPAAHQHAENFQLACLHAFFRVRWWPVSAYIKG
ncbi:hypothetical protein D3C80_1152340 [compost metagenome]